jgi:hypothetical protein
MRGSAGSLRGVQVAGAAVVPGLTCLGNSIFQISVERESNFFEIGCCNYALSYCRARVPELVPSQEVSFFDSGNLNRSFCLLPTLALASPHVCQQTINSPVLVPRSCIDHGLRYFW